MGLFNRDRAEEPIDPSWYRVTGLVLAADAPPQGAPSRGPHSKGTIRVVIDSAATGRRVLGAPLRYTDAHWLAMGMPVPVAVDPVHPEVFVVDWAAVPPMQQQAEANHPALADPFTAARQVAAAAGVAPNEKTAARADRFRAEVAQAATKPAPAGRLRAVAIVATVRGRFETTGGDADGSGPTSSGVTLNANSAAVLSVAVPGRPPYAVYLAKFKIPSRRLSIPGEPMPVLVSATNPRDIEILWDEMPSMGDQIAARMADQARSTEKFQAAMSEQYQAAIAQAIANPAGYPPAAYPPGTYPPGTYPPGAYPPGAYPPAPQPAGNYSATPPPAGGYPAPPPPPAGYPGAGQPGAVPAGMPPQVRQMMIENLRRSLLNVDPAHRRMVLDQYRAMGLAITEEELGI